MSCIINLLDEVIVGETEGGTLEFLFYDSDQDGDADSGGTPIDIDSSGNVNFDFVNAGDYYFKYKAPIGEGYCEPSEELIFFVRVLDRTDAGFGMTVDLCDDDEPVNVFTFLLGSADTNGVWTGSAVESDGWIDNVDPTLVEFDPSLVPLGVYEATYTVTQVAPPGFTLSGCENCGSSTTTVTFNVESCMEPPPPCNLGGSNSISVCSSAGCTFDLIDQLTGTPDSGGTWTWLSGPAVIIPSGSDGTVNFIGAPVGVYQFRYNIVGCQNSAIVTVQVVAQPWAGNNGFKDLCESNGSTNLFPSLGGNPNGGGTWTISPALPNGTFSSNGFINPAPGDEGTYIATYTISNPVNGPCGTNCSDSATVTVEITENCVALAGSDTICEDESITLNATVLMPGSTGGGTWGVAGVSVNCNNNYTQPCIFSVNGAPATNHFGETLPSGSVLSNFASLGCYLFVYTCQTPDNLFCSAQSYFTLQVIDCSPDCNSAVTISAAGCLLSIVSITNCPNPIRQWQLFQSGTWIPAPGDNDNATYLGTHGNRYRLRITGCPNCPAIFSNEIVVSCPPPPDCVLSCTLTYNTGNQQLVATFSNSGAPTSVNYQFSKATTGLVGACTNCGGWGVPTCTGTDPDGNGTVTCNVPQSNVEQCWRFCVFGSGCNTTCCCVKIPAISSLMCYEIPGLTSYTEIIGLTVNTGSGNTNIINNAQFSCDEYCSILPTGTSDGNLNCSLAQLVIDINQWLSANGHSGTAYMIQSTKASAIKIKDTNVIFVNVLRQGTSALNFIPSGSCTAGDTTTYHFQGVDSQVNFPLTVGTVYAGAPGSVNIRTLMLNFYADEILQNGTFAAATSSLPLGGNCAGIVETCYTGGSPPVTIINNPGNSNHGLVSWSAFTAINCCPCFWQFSYLVSLGNGFSECFYVQLKFTNTPP